MEHYFEVIHLIFILLVHFHLFLFTVKPKQRHTNTYKHENKLRLREQGSGLSSSLLFSCSFFPSVLILLEGAHWLNCSPWPGTIVTIWMSCFMTGGAGKVYSTNKPPPTRRVRERSKRDTACLTTSQNPHWHPSWLNKVCTTRKDSESE